MTSYDLLVVGMSCFDSDFEDDFGSDEQFENARGTGFAPGRPDTLPDLNHFNVVPTNVVSTETLKEYLCPVANMAQAN